MGNLSHWSVALAVLAALYAVIASHATGVIYDISATLGSLSVALSAVAAIGWVIQRREV